MCFRTQACGQNRSYMNCGPRLPFFLVKPAQQRLHLRLGEEHNIIVARSEQLHVRIPERVLAKRSLVHDVKNDLPDSSKAHTADYKTVY